MDQAHAGATEPATGALPPGVTAALERLEFLDGLPTSAHVAAFEDVQRRLDDALADIDDAQGAATAPTTAAATVPAANTVPATNTGYPRPQAPHSRPQAPRPQPPASAGRHGERGNPSSRDEA